jgi:hypothetical protein
MLICDQCMIKNYPEYDSGSETAYYRGTLCGKRHAAPQQIEAGQAARVEDLAQQTALVCCIVWSFVGSIKRASDVRIFYIPEDTLRRQGIYGWLDTEPYNVSSDVYGAMLRRLSKLCTEYRQPRDSRITRVFRVAEELKSCLPQTSLV